MKIPQRTIASIVALIFVFVAGTANAQRANNQESEQQQTRQAQAVSRSVYEVIEKAQRLVEAEEYDAAIALLTALIQKDNLTEYEFVNVYQYLGYCYHSKEDTEAAIATFSKILEIETVEEQTRKATLYTLSQLHTIVEQYDEALISMERWFALEPNPAPDAFILYAQILYQLGRYEDMISPIETALAVAATRDTAPKEQWYSLLSFAYFQQEDFAKIRDINKLLIANWPKKRYWLYLANAFRELNNEDRFLAAYDSAHLQGLLNSESELVTLAQLYLQAEVPYKAASLLEDEMESGRIEKSGKNYRLLSQAWFLAREDSRSVEPLKIAAELDEKGNLYIRLANVYLNLDQNDSCISAVRAGIEKGGLKSPDYAQMSLGMCLYNAYEYHKALRAFRSAAKTPRSAATANEWIKITKIDIQRDEEIATAEARADQRIQNLEERRLASDRS